MFHLKKNKMLKAGDAIYCNSNSFCNYRREMSFRWLLSEAECCVPTHCESEWLTRHGVYWSHWKSSKEKLYNMLTSRGRLRSPSSNTNFIINNLSNKKFLRVDLCFKWSLDTVLTLKISWRINLLMAVDENVSWKCYTQDNL